VSGSSSSLALAGAAESLDLESCFGKRPVAFNVDRLLGMEGVLIGDKLVVDVAAELREDRLLAVVLPDSDEPVVGRCVLRSGRFCCRVPGKPDQRLDVAGARVRGIVVGLVRTYR
jgi:hypothetical protein